MKTYHEIPAQSSMKSWFFRRSCFSRDSSAFTPKHRKFTIPISVGPTFRKVIILWKSRGSHPPHAHFPAAPAQLYLTILLFPSAQLFISTAPIHHRKSAKKPQVSGVSRRYRKAARACVRCWSRRGVENGGNRREERARASARSRVRYDSGAEYGVPSGRVKHGAHRGKGSRGRAPQRETEEGERSHPLPDRCSPGGQTRCLPSLAV